MDLKGNNPKICFLALQLNFPFETSGQISAKRFSKGLHKGCFQVKIKCLMTEIDILTLHTSNLVCLPTVSADYDVESLSFNLM